MESTENNNLDFSDIYAFFKDYDLQYFKNKHEILDIIQSFLEKYDNDQAFYIVDLTKVIHQYQRWIHNLPNVKPHYAVKCNPNQVIIELLAKLGCNFDCASRDEIAQVLSAGVSPDRIIFANPVKASNQIKYARQEDIDLMTFDSISELYKIKLYHPKAQLVIRIKVDDSKSVCQFSSKFGASTEELENIFSIAKTCQLNLVGVSFHVGSNCYGVESYDNAIKDAYTTFEMAKKHGFHFHLLDIGGGFPSNNTKLTFEEIAQCVQDSISKYFSDYPELEVIAEPGRFMVATSHTLVLNVIGKKEYINPDTREKTFKYYLNDGVYGSYNCIYFDHARPTILPYNERDGKLYKSTVMGVSCDALDVIDKNCMLPDLEIGEWVYTEDMGAYTVSSSAASFNGFKIPKCVYCITENIKPNNE